MLRVACYELRVAGYGFKQFRILFVPRIVLVLVLDTVSNNASRINVFDYEDDDDLINTELLSASIRNYSNVFSRIRNPEDTPRFSRCGNAASKSLCQIHRDFHHLSIT